jgi:hypothetical protein
MVEAQHLVSTLKVVDALAEQTVLEEELERTKPLVPSECRSLHYLLATPFRYDSVYPRGSRFRRAGRTAGVFYASETPRTAAAEMAFHRLLFFLESPATGFAPNASEFTMFAVAYGSNLALDLTIPPLSHHRRVWVHPTEYSRCQELTDAARQSAIELIRYESVRDPEGGTNIALLSCRAFSAKIPQSRQTWRLYLGSKGVQALCESPRMRLEFPRAVFASDPRITAARP